MRWRSLTCIPNQTVPAQQKCIHAGTGEAQRRPTIADLERVYNELTAQGRLILRYRKEEN